MLHLAHLTVTELGLEALLFLSGILVGALLARPALARLRRR